MFYSLWNVLVLWNDDNINLATACIWIDYFMSFVLSNFISAIFNRVVFTTHTPISLFGFSVEKQVHIV